VRSTTELTRVERVAFYLAVRRLSTAVPAWRDRVDPDRLDMTCADRCVLGQVFGDYGAGLTALENVVLPEFHDRAFAPDFPVAPWLAELRRYRTSRPVDDRDLVGAA
jgi:hypothetical protein